MALYSKFELYFSDPKKTHFKHAVYKKFKILAVLKKIDVPLQLQVP